MKIPFASLLALLFAFVSPFATPTTASAGSLVTPIRMEISPLSDDLAITSYIGFAPKENAANLAGQSITWPTFASNWIEILRTGAPFKGSGFDFAAKQANADYSWMVTSSSFRSWNLGLTTEQQFGNRNVISLDVRSLRSGVTFKPNRIVMTVRSYDHMDDLVRWQPDVINITASFASSNYFRLRLEAGLDGVTGTPDDVLSSSQDLNLATMMFRYGGLMPAIGAFGSGDNTQQLQNGFNYYRDTHTVLRLVVTVPYDDGGTAKTFQTSLVIIPTQSGVESRVVDMPLTLDLAHNRIHMGEVGNSPALNRIYAVEQSTDLTNWNMVFYPDLGQGEITPFKIDGGLARNFFRVREFSPPVAEEGPLAQFAGPLAFSPAEQPVDDSIAP
ncbi:MAG: hypothetical protein RJB39_411 [Candidatus Parcubacteria bacterium]|jgi:hypothetical protein